MAKLFGFKIPDGEDKKSKGVVSPVPPSDEDKSDFYVSSGFYGQYVDIEGVYKSEQDLVRRYREMCLHPECDSAICLLYTSPSPRDTILSRMPSSA